MLKRIKTVFHFNRIVGKRSVFHCFVNTLAKTNDIDTMEYANVSLRYGRSRKRALDPGQMSLFSHAKPITINFDTDATVEPYQVRRRT